MAILLDGQLGMAGSLDNIVWVWDIQSRALIKRLMGHKDSMYSITFMPDSKGLVSRSLDQMLKVESSVDKGAKLHAVGIQGCRGVGCVRLASCKVVREALSRDGRPKI